MSSDSAEVDDISHQVKDKMSSDSDSGDIDDT
jgi:hypothetical protein